MTQGVIGLMMTKILGLIDRYIEASAERREKILEKIIQRSKMIADAFKDLEPIFKEWANIFEELAGIFAVPMEELQNTSDNVSDATKDACSGQCELEKRKKILDLGLAELNQLGRPGTVKAEVFVPHEQSGDNRDATNNAASNNTGGSNRPYVNYDHPVKDKTEDEWGVKDKPKDEWANKDGKVHGRGGDSGHTGGKGEGKEDADWTKEQTWNKEQKESTDKNTDSTGKNTEAADKNTA